MTKIKFKEGESGNPFGSLPIGQDLKEARKLTRVEFERLANKYLHMTWDQIEKIFKEEKKSIPAIEMMILSIMHKAIIEGDERRFEFLLDRTIGQAVRKIQVVTEVDDAPKAPPVPMSDADKIKMLDTYKAILMSKDSANKDVIDVSNNKQPEGDK